MNILNKIRLTEIDFQDKTYIFSYPASNAQLERTIKEFGFISPPVLKKKGASYRIVSGYKRLLIAQKAGIKEINAFITDIDDYKAFKFSVLENTAHRALNIFEISSIIHKLLNEFKILKSDIIANYLPLWGYQAYDKIFKQLVILANLSLGQRDALFNAQIESEKSIILSEFPEDIWDVAITILIDMKPGANKFKHLSETLREIVQREKITYKQLFSEPNIKDIFLDPVRTSSQKFELLRKKLNERRNPVITIVEEEYHKKYAQLQLDKKIKLIHPPGFEGKEFKVELNFKDKNQLHKYAVNLLNIAENPILDELLNFL
ncbi:ParB-like nuclease domain-containing protein [bacterium]|nr:ParB-like nuclease domain-containing protein [bacterium]